LDGQYKEFRLSEALKTIYSLIWDDFCSWYLEWVKPGFEQPIDKNVYESTVTFFEELMLLLHPFTPFITEEVYHQLRDRVAGDDITIKQQSAAGNVDNVLIAQGQLLKDLITGIRDVRNKQQIKPKETIGLSIQTENAAAYNELLSLFSKQVNAREISFVTASVPGTITAVIGKDKFYLEAEKPVDTGNQIEELLKELEYQKGFLIAIDKKLGNERFVQNAKPEVVELERRKKADAEEKIRVIEESLSSLL